MDYWALVGLLMTPQTKNCVLLSENVYFENGQQI
jgi:hypothetical protein